MNPTHLPLFRKTHGAISIHEFFALQWLATQAPKEGVILDIGTNNGKGALAHATGFSEAGIPRDMFCIDTVFDLENKDAWADNRTQDGPMTTGWHWIYEPDFKYKVQERILIASEHLITPYLIGESALKAIPKYARPGVAFAFCDADNNQKWLVDGIVNELADKMVSGGIIAHHDWNSQFIAPTEAQERLLATEMFTRVQIPWDEIQRAVDANGGEHEGNESWHHRETARPMFVGAIRRI